MNRISINPNLRAVPFWSPQELYAGGGFDLIRSDTQEKCQLLRSLGVNLNFAPVLRRPRRIPRILSTAEALEGMPGRRRSMWRQS